MTLVCSRVNMGKCLSLFLSNNFRVENEANPNQPCQHSLWEETGVPGGKPTTFGRVLTESFHIGNHGCLPFTQRFQYFRMENKWNTHFWSTQPENYQNKRFARKGCPL